MCSLASPLSCSWGSSWSIACLGGSSHANLQKLIGLLSAQAAMGVAGAWCLSQASLAEGGSLGPRLCICPITKTCQDFSKIALLFFSFSLVGQTRACLVQSPLQDLTCCLAVGTWLGTASRCWLLLRSSSTFKPGSLSWSVFCSYNLTLQAG